MADGPVFDLSRFPVHLGLGATVTTEPEHLGGMEWYQAYGERHARDGVEGRLVTMHTFSTPWGMWEMHPKGHELVVCIAGKIVVHQEIDGEVRTVTLSPKDAVVNAPGVWHTADVDAPATALFITAGEGTQHRPR
ncbi:MAG: cupin [Myxococcales bacterium]|nr:cupin [Myxococcales bacterium]